MNKKICIKCGVPKEEDQFPFQSYKRSDGSKARRTECKTCTNKKRDERRKRRGESESRKKAQLEKCSNYYHGNEEIREKRRIENRRKKLKSEYNMTLEDYDDILKDQDCKCKICSKPAEEAIRGILDIDHCHSTGKIRGLLCTDCNNLLGRAKDNIEILRRAISYLEAYN